jgi:hypothetical protein
MVCPRDSHLDKVWSSYILWRILSSIHSTFYIPRCYCQHSAPVPSSCRNKISVFSCPSHFFFSVLLHSCAYPAHEFMTVLQFWLARCCGRVESCHSSPNVVFLDRGKQSWISECVLSQKFFRYIQSHDIKCIQPMHLISLSFEEIKIFEGTLNF